MKIVKYKEVSKLTKRAADVAVAVAMLFRKSGSEIVSITYIKKAVAKSQPISCRKVPDCRFRTAFCTRMLPQSMVLQSRTSKGDYVVKTICPISQIPPQRTFSQNEVRAGWLFHCPRTASRQAVMGCPNHCQSGVCQSHSATDRPQRKVHLYQQWLDQKKSRSKWIFKWFC